MRHLMEYEDHDLKDLIGDLKSVGQVEEWQVIFDDQGEEVPYTLETWTTKKEAEDWAEDREVEYEDYIYDPRKEDYAYKTFYKYHNPEDGQSYTGYEIKKI